MYTMIRCALFAAALVCTAAQAQTHRPFPADALRGEMQVQVAPELLMNGKPARLAPGSRIRNETNFLVTPGEMTVRGKLVVHYTQESDGLVKDVWVLNPAELANKRWPKSRAEAAAWRFDAATQTWIKP
jgi:hypothetical protein